MNDRTYTYLEIRGLLDRWYAGETTPDDERRLAGLLASAGSDLPADLAAESALFAEMTQLKSEETSVPEDFDRRIDSALEREMSGAAGFETALRRHRLVAGIAGAAAVCAVVAGVFLHMPRAGAPEGIASSVSPKIERILNDTAAAVEAMAVTPQAEIKPETLASVDNVRKHKSVKSRKAVVKKSTDEEEYDETVAEDDFLDPEERERLLAANYRIVENEAEADMIISSVFDRMESRVSREGMMISNICERYSAQISDL